MCVPLTLCVTLKVMCGNKERSYNIRIPHASKFLRVLCLEIKIALKVFEFITRQKNFMSHLKVIEGRLFDPAKLTAWRGSSQP